MAELIPLADALTRLCALAKPVESESVELRQSLGRMVSHSVLAKRTQPAAPLSAMDGYAVRAMDLPGPWQVVGESSAGHPFAGALDINQAIRISTGAIVPPSADCVIVQEDVSRNSDRIRLTGDGPVPHDKHIRKLGMDFISGATVIAAGTRINGAHMALAAMAGHASLSVARRIRVALFDTGDELAPPGAALADGQIPATNAMMLAALVSSLPVDIVATDIIPDSLADTAAMLESTSNADIIVTTGGASVGDHDHVQPALKAIGAELDFWRIAMKPGKPVMVARRGASIYLGLPGNPVSAYVTAFLLLLPLIRQMSSAKHVTPRTMTAPTDADLPANGARQEFIRAHFGGGNVTPLGNQDSSALSVLAAANALINRPAHATAVQAGDMVDMLPIEPF